jgi:hypothetical protein
VNAGRFSFEIHKFAPSKRAFTNLLRGHSDSFVIHGFAAEHGVSEQIHECGRVLSQADSGPFDIHVFAPACC